MVIYDMGLQGGFIEIREKAQVNVNHWDVMGLLRFRFPWVFGVFVSCIE